MRREFCGSRWGVRQQKEPPNYNYKMQSLEGDGIISSAHSSGILGSKILERDQRVFCLLRNSPPLCGHWCLLGNSNKGEARSDTISNIVVFLNLSFLFSIA